MWCFCIQCALGKADPRDRSFQALAIVWISEPQRLRSSALTNAKPKSRAEQSAYCLKRSTRQRKKG